MSKKLQKTITSHCINMIAKAIVLDYQKKGAGYKWLEEEVAKLDNFRKDLVISKEVELILKLK
jgi:hypothetical protein